MKRLDLHWVGPTCNLCWLTKFYLGIKSHLLPTVLGMLTYPGLSISIEQPESLWKFFGIEKVNANILPSIPFIKIGQR